MAERDHDLRQAARRAFDAAVLRADPGAALAGFLNSATLPRPAPGGVTRIVALGKAAPAMLRALLPLVDGDVEAVCITHRENDDKVAGVTTFRAGHPVPDETGAAAANFVAKMLIKSNPEDIVIALISGGGSALLPAPPPGVSLADKRQLNRLLLASGLDISAMNLIRQQVSQLKGGGLARMASPARVTAYILSDVVGDDLRAIASGPTVAPIGTRAEALDLLCKTGLQDQVPASILAHLDAPDPDTGIPPSANHLIGGNAQSVRAAADALSDVYDVTVAPDPLVGDVADAAHTVLTGARKAATGRRPCALVWGGETTVRLQGTGLGGRNQELALRVAGLADDTPLMAPWVFLSGGTDGRDGPTEAAGAIVDQGTFGRIREMGRNPRELLENNDSNAALRLSGDLLVTGPTGTNVADIQIFLVG